MPLRPSAALLSRKAFLHNFKVIASRLRQQTALHGPRSEMMAVVKADAYGHGLAQVARELLKRNCRYFCVASLEEGEQLRRIVGSKAKILILGGTLRWNRASIQKALEHRFEIAINDIASLKIFAAHPKILLHLKLDTGMNRLGLKSEEWSEALAILLKKKIKLEGLFTHYATFNDDTFSRQVMLFEEAVRWFGAEGVRPRWIHSENSAALFSPARLKKGVLSERGNLARPGLALLGYMPGNFSSRVDLQPVLELQAEIGLIKKIKKGEGISYDMLYRAKKAHEVGVVPLGYADGVAKDYAPYLKPRLLDKLGRKKAGLTICGAVCMDMLMVRASKGRISAGDRVVFWGRFPNDLLRHQRVGPYELNLRIAPRIPRVWVP